MKKLKTKAETRAELEADMDRFLSKGGKVDTFSPGISGHEIGVNPFQAIPLQRQQQNRTLVNDAIAAIEARRKTPRSVKSKPSPSKPKRRLITDDFGQPLRWVWED
ncbi:hypothetical protein [Marinibactrum halimedae]|uniref:Transcriptional regulator SutA RNAP-binding domain-containing protein n=1 Tax=Marinibactrum halimedae TaxID=1444977 RepID=A0AA37T3V4_9GAMM|nr:hypothetical protein [Marinibactrum halimedae]MCD9458132.1 hypothetical protein [Marinibactrum halimedae]GLS25066.1 hypothetical protein GCM10007877_07800 [Marinibactrum halimedae]